jgi:hypothetical protein
MDEVFILMDFLFIQVPLLPRQMDEKSDRQKVYPAIFSLPTGL